MESASLKNFNQNRLGLELAPVFVAQLGLLESLNSPAYAYQNGVFKTVLSPGEGITDDFIREYAQDISREIFISHEDLFDLQEKLGDHITRLARSMSSGDAMKNSIRQSNLLSLQMNNLYQDPFDDGLLNAQVQNSKNFGSMLMNNKNIHRSLYQNIKKQGHHYTIKQPLLSSVLLLSFAQHGQFFTEKEIQGLFLASYFKDIGMSYIPREKFESAKLSEEDKMLFADHAENSMKILKGRAGLSNNQLNMIEHHHFLNYLVQAKVQNIEIKPSDLPLYGIESVLMSSMDILVAMTSDRPYRPSVSIFVALEFLKKTMGDQFPQEFRQLVYFLRQFFA